MCLGTTYKSCPGGLGLAQTTKLQQPPAGAHELSLHAASYMRNCCTALHSVCHLHSLPLLLLQIPLLLELLLPKFMLELKRMRLLQGVT